MNLFLAGIRIYTNPFAPQFREVVTEIPLSFFDRWILPFTSYKNLVEMPFQPWVKNKTIVTKEMWILQTPDEFIIHPANFKRLQEEIGRSYE